MDYLYINSIIHEVYRDIPCGCSFPAAIRQKMQRYSANDDFLQSGIDNNLSCFTLRADDARSAPVLVLMNAARQQSSKSVGRYTQCMGWVWNSSLLHDGYDAVLNTGFYSEEEILNAAAAQTPVPFPSKSTPFAYMDIQIAPNTVRAVLTALILRWTKGDAILRIAVPREVDYNSYVLSAVRKLYSYMPYALRMQAGFTSYLSNPAKDLPQISIGFIPEAQADNNTMFLNGSSVAVINKLLQEGTHRNSLDTFLAHLCRLDEADRKEYLALVNREVEQNADQTDDGRKLSKVTAKDYAILGECLELENMTGPLEEKVPIWRQFFKNSHKYPPTFRERVEKKIGDGLDPQAFADYYCRLCTHDPDQIFSEYKTMAGFCAKYPILKDRLWDAFLSQMRQSGAPYQRIQELVTSSPKESQHLLPQGQTQMLQLSVLEERISNLNRSVVPETVDREALYNEIQSIDQEVLPHLSSANSAETEKASQLQQNLTLFWEQMNEAWNHQLYEEKSGKFQKIKEIPDTSVESLEKSIHQAKKFAEEIANQPTLEQLQAEVNTFIAERQQKRDAADTKYNALQRKVDASISYFEACTVLFDPDFKDLEQPQKERIRKEIHDSMPSTFSAYESAFESYFRKKLNTVSLAELKNDRLCQKILEDLSKLPEIAVSLPATSQDIRGVMEGAGSITSRIFPNASIAIQVGTEPYPLDQLQQLLSFQHFVFQGESADKAINLLLTLGSHNILTKNDLLPCVKALPRKGEPAQQVLEKLVLSGRFQGADSQQYTAAYQCLFELFSQATSKAEAADILRQSLRNAQTNFRDVDTLAANTLESFLETLETKGKKSSRTVAIITSTVAAALVLVAGGIGAYFLLRTPPQNGVRISRPVSENPIQNPVPSFLEQLFGTVDSPKTFEDHTAAASKILALAENPVVCKAVESRYNTPLPDALIGNATWEEYFFWTCFVHADDSIESIISVFDAPTPDTAVMKILALLHGNDVPNMQTEPLVEMTTPGADNDEYINTAEDGEYAGTTDGTALNDSPDAYESSAPAEGTEHTDIAEVPGPDDTADAFEPETEPAPTEAPTLEEIFQKSAEASKEAFDRTAKAYWWANGTTSLSQ